MYEKYIAMHLLMSVHGSMKNEARMEEKLMPDLPGTQSSGIVRFHINRYIVSHYTHNNIITIVHINHILQL